MPQVSGLMSQVSALNLPPVVGAGTLVAPVAPVKRTTPPLARYLLSKAHKEITP